MLIRVGDVYVDPNRVIAVVPCEEDDGSILDNCCLVLDAQTEWVFTKVNAETAFSKIQSALDCKFRSSGK